MLPSLPSVCSRLWRETIVANARAASPQELCSRERRGAFHRTQLPGSLNVANLQPDSDGVCWAVGWAVAVRFHLALVSGAIGLPTRPRQTRDGRPPATH